MGKKSKVIPNVFLNAFTYDVLYKATVEQKRGLNGRYLKAAKNSTTATAFSNSADIEDRAILLSKLNIPFAWVFGKLEDKNLTEIYHTYKSDGQAKALKSMMEQ